MSSYQPDDLAALEDNWDADHLIVRLYLPWESAQNREHSRLQMQSGNRLNAAGRATRGAYAWAYGSSDAEATIYEAYDLAARDGYTFPILWLDEEVYSYQGVYDAGPNERWNDAAAEYAERESGVNIGIYTGGWWWDTIGQAARNMRHLPLWASDYRRWPSILDVPLFGGWEQLAGWQYAADQGIDRSWMWDDVA